MSKASRRVRPGKFRKLTREERAKVRARMNDAMNRVNAAPLRVTIPSGHEKPGQVRVVSLPDGWRRDKKGRYVDQFGVPY